MFFVKHLAGDTPSLSSGGLSVLHAAAASIGLAALEYEIMPYVSIEGVAICFKYAKLASDSWIVVACLPHLKRLQPYVFAGFNHSLRQEDKSIFANEHSKSAYPRSKK